MDAQRHNLACFSDVHEHDEEGGQEQEVTLLVGLSSPAPLPLPCLGRSRGFLVWYRQREAACTDSAIGVLALLQCPLPAVEIMAETLRDEGESMGESTVLWRFALLAFSSVFSIVNPFSTAPLFVTMTADDPLAKRHRTAWRAVATAGVTLMLFAVLGEALLRLFSITLGAFRIAGGLILFGMGMTMLRAQHPREQQTPEEISEGTAKDDIALIPLAIPMLSGPGAISTVIVLGQQAGTWSHRLVLLAVIVLTCVLSYAILRSVGYVTRILGPTGLRLVSRLMGLLLAVIAVQFILNGVQDALLSLRLP
jgi:multiple antibiotic resistance protein